MRGFDLINAALPDELILEIFRHLDSKPNRDACSLVCKRWLSLERLSHDTIRIGAPAAPDNLVVLLSSHFPNTRYVFIDERLSVSLPVPYVGGSLLLLALIFYLVYMKSYQLETLMDDLFRLVKFFLFVIRFRIYYLFFCCFGD